MCMIGLHKWGLWSQLVQTGGSGHKFQFRECLECGKAQSRDLGYCDGARADFANLALRPVGAYRGYSSLEIPRMDHE